MSVVNVKVAHIRPQYSNLEEWCAEPNNVYIGRRGIVFIDGVRYPQDSSPFANPFKLIDEIERGAVVTQYERYILDRIEKGEVDLETLRGKTLGCWCKPKRCHGDILLKLLSRPMTVGVVGCRDFTDYIKFSSVLDRYPIREIVTGDWRGTDSMARDYTYFHKYIGLILCEAAGPIRNATIIERSELLIAFVSSSSKGTPGIATALTKAKSAGISTVIVKI